MKNTSTKSTRQSVETPITSTPQTTTTPPPRVITIPPVLVAERSWPKGATIVLLLLLSLLAILGIKREWEKSPTISVLIVAVIVLALWLWHRRSDTSSSPKTGRGWKWLAIILFVGLIVCPTIVNYIRADPNLQRKISMSTDEQRLFPYYGPLKCDPSEVQIINFWNTTLPRGKGLEIDLGREVDKGQSEGCYGVLVVIPRMCAEGGCDFSKSQEPGDYASLWWENENHHRPIRSASH